MATWKMISRRFAGSPATVILFITSLLLLAWTFEMVHRSVTQQQNYKALLKQLEDRDKNAHARALDSLVVTSECEAIQPVKHDDMDKAHVRPYRAFSQDPVAGNIREEMDFARVLLHYGKSTLKVLSKRTLPRKLGISAEAIVPNVVHYLWVGGSEFTFQYYLSMRSVEMSISPQYIVVHGDVVPSGSWWNQALEDVPNIVFMKKELTQYLGNIKIHDETVLYNIARMEIILDYGGILVDPDIFILKPLDALRRHPFVLGREGQETLSLGLILGQRGSAFLRLLLETYHSALFQGKDNSHLLLLPHYLTVMFPNLVHVEERSFGLSRDNLPVLLSIHIDWHRHHAMRFIDTRLQMPKHADQIKLMDSTVGEIARYIYFGDKQIL